MRLSLPRVLEHRHLPAFLIGAGLLLTLPSLFIGWRLDDYLHRSMLIRQFSGAANDASLFGLFSFFDGNPARMAEMQEDGLVQWWAYRGARAALWRPLTEATHWLDYRLWRRSPLMMHAQNLCWFGLVIWLMTRLYRRIIGAGRVAGLAALLFAIDNAHGVTVGWIANRNALIAAAFGVFALLAHDRWRRDGWKPGAFLAPGSFAIGLLAGETTLAAGAYLLAYMLCIEQGRLRRRIVEFLPYIAIVGVWSATYRALGFGTQYTGLYIDPGQQTGLFLRALFKRAPLLLLGQFAEPPAQVSALLSPAGVTILWSAAVLLLALIGIALFPLLRRDPTARFWALGMMLSLVPVCATFPHNRLLLFPGIGAIGLVAQFLSEKYGFKPTPCPSQEGNAVNSLPGRGRGGLPETGNLSTPQPTPNPSQEGSSAASPCKSPHLQGGKRWVAETRKQRLWQRIANGVAIVFIVTHLIIAPLTLPLASVEVAAYEELFVRRGFLPLPFGYEVANKTGVFLNPPIAFFSLFVPFIETKNALPIPGHLYTLSSGMLGATVTRVDDRTLDMAIPGGWWQIELDRISRGADAPLHVGEQAQLQRMTAEVLEMTPDGQPSRVRFRFNAPLEDRSLLFVVWRPGQPPSIYTPPAVGVSETLERLPLPLPFRAETCVRQP
ncbi:hypothetical protein U14_04828 [Candidatus Moduliflexus flocculans]|uniref:Glycosyltransferase RgtA/B/C/D-like domain-containing protein n=1 Tax=Candidatus Moduliflexus flocculans TaxID=1499966 RepID=A0A0S6W5P2_9BACT|nr:hypothetical protein U14_04828 [Candidatus Moduliflexus flocculans]